MNLLQHSLAKMIVLGSILTLVAQGAVQGPSAKPQEDLASDQQRRHEQIVTGNNQEYEIGFHGTIDGTMTRMPISYGAYVQGWQPNRWARIENIGESDVVNPWLTINGRGDWRTIEAIVTEATRGCTTDAEKARALWEWERTQRFHATTWDGEVADAVKAHNIYGYTLCGDDAVVLGDLWKTAGLKTRRGYPVGHCVTEVFYAGAFHLLDGDEHVICLLRDNRTIAAEAEVVRDHDLMKRTHTYGIASQEDELQDQFSAALYPYEGKREGDRRFSAQHTMHFVLRPGDALEWRWSHVGKEYSAGKELAPGATWKSDGEGTLRSGWGPTAHDNLRNGKWIYRPPLEKALYRQGVQAEENVACSAEDGLKPNLHPAKTGQAAQLTWKITSPYVLVGATVQCLVWRKTEGDAFLLSWSKDGKNWIAVGQADQLGASTVTAHLDQLLSPRGQPMYSYLIRAEMQSATGSGVGLNDISFDSDVQMALLAMPELTVGNNSVRYTDESTGSRKVRITHAWMERTQWHPPAPPKEIQFPPDGATVEGTKFTFRWMAAKGGDAGDTIADYHIQVCDRADLRWPLSPNFDKLVSRTPSAGKSEWTIPFTGLLNPDTDYYWRVRAKDNKGVWGEWSRSFRFRCAAPGVPLNLRVIAEGGVPTALAWDDNPTERKPSTYRVYGSNEKGFTASDAPYLVRMGNGFCETMAEYKAKDRKDAFCGDVKTPANFLLQTKQARMALSNPLFAYYRVSAVDANGNASGPSDYAELPRPFIYTSAATRAKVGQPYAYRPAATFSLGHLTCRDGYSAAFWDREKLTWTQETGPTWLRMNNGKLRGTPTEDDVGCQDVILKVVNDKGGSAKQQFRIAVEK